MTINHTNREYHTLRVIRIATLDELCRYKRRQVGDIIAKMNRHKYWSCRCTVCSKIHIVRADYLTRKKCRCGAWTAKIKRKAAVSHKNRIYGTLQTLHKATLDELCQYKNKQVGGIIAKTTRHKYWYCRCTICNKVHVVRADYLSRKVCQCKVV